MNKYLLSGSCSILPDFHNFILPLIVFLIAGVNTNANAQFVQAPASESPKAEFRSVWLTTAFGLDWPKTTNVEDQKESLRLIIQRAANMKLNAIVFQVVSRADAQYDSERLPWSRYLTGTQGQDPGWDPLQFLIDEARPLGLEVHAWYNVFNVGVQTDTSHYINSVTPHLFTEHRDWVRLVGTNEIWLNPGIPAARQWAVDNVVEIVQNYDIDAIHFDFIRYPQSNFSDDNTMFAQFNANNIANIFAWRRDNVSQFNRDAHAAVKAIKPWVKVGSTPVGHYQNSNGWPALFGYTAVSQDAPLWLQEGVNDYAAPQLYWAIGTPNPDFNWLANDWKGRNFGRHIYIGIGAYRPTSSSDNQNVAAELGRQIDSIRVNNFAGHMFFRYDNIYAFNVQTGGLGARLNYGRPALVPTMDWITTAKPDAPVNQIATITENQVNLSWTPPVFNDNGDNLVKYAIYRVQSFNEPDPTVVISDPYNLHAISGTSSFTESVPNIQERFYYVITSLSRNWVESDAIQVLDVATPTSIEQADHISRGYILEQNYPNPFNPVTNIRYELPEMGDVRLTVFDITGRKISEIVRLNDSPGVHTISYDARNLASGIYIYSLDVNGIRLTKKMTVIK